VAVFRWLLQRVAMPQLADCINYSAMLKETVKVRRALVVLWVISKLGY